MHLANLGKPSSNALLPPVFNAFLPEKVHTIQYTTVYYSIPLYTTVYHCILQYITVYHCIPQYITVYHCILQYTTVYC